MFRTFYVHLQEDYIVHAALCGMFFVRLCMQSTRLVGRVAQSVQRLATGWTVRGSNPGGARFSAPVQTGPGAHPASCTMGTGSFTGVKSGRNVTLTPHPLLVLLVMKE